MHILRRLPPRARKPEGRVCHGRWQVSQVRMGSIALVTFGLPTSQIHVLTVEAVQFGSILTAGGVCPEFSPQSQISHPRVAGFFTAGTRSSYSTQSCGHHRAAPEQQQPRAAPHGREEPGAAGPGGCGREPRPLGCGMKRRRPQEGPGPWFLPPPGAPGLVSGRRQREARGRDRAGRWGDPRAPAWRVPGTWGAVGAPGP